MPNCQRCGEIFPDSHESGGKIFNVSKRKYCLTGRPFGASAPLPQFKRRATSECIICSKPLSGRQEMFCSVQCKTHAHSSYPKQKDRAIIRKLRLLEIAGGACSVCGYDKNVSCFHFHHIDPSKKLFQLDGRAISNHTWDVVLEEFSKCILVCSNCHFELHHPDMGYKELKIKFAGEISI